MHTIAITGVGGGVGQSILKSLDNSGYNIVALDGEALAAGLYTAPKSYIIPYSGKPDFIPALLQICEKEKVSLLFPGLDAELMPLSLRICIHSCSTPLLLKNFIFDASISVSQPTSAPLAKNKSAELDEAELGGLFPQLKNDIKATDKIEVTTSFLI